MAVRQLRSDERPAPAPLEPPVEVVVRQRNVRIDIRCTPATPTVGQPMTFFARAIDLETRISTEGGPEKLQFAVVDPRGITTPAGADYAPTVPGMHTVAVAVDPNVGGYTKFYVLAAEEGAS